MSEHPFILSCESTVGLPYSYVALRERFPKMQSIRICDIGCITVPHAGLGTVAAVFLGDPRAPEK